MVPPLGGRDQRMPIEVPQRTQFMLLTCRPEDTPPDLSDCRFAEVVVTFWPVACARASTVSSPWASRSRNGLLVEECLQYTGHEFGGDDVSLPVERAVSYTHLTLPTILRV